MSHAPEAKLRGAPVMTDRLKARLDNYLRVQGGFEPKYGLLLLDCPLPEIIARLRRVEARELALYQKGRRRAGFACAAGFVIVLVGMAAAVAIKNYAPLVAAAFVMMLVHALASDRSDHWKVAYAVRGVRAFLELQLAGPDGSKCAAAVKQPPTG